MHRKSCWSENIFCSCRWRFCQTKSFSNYRQSLSEVVCAVQWHRLRWNLFATEFQKIFHWYGLRLRVFYAVDQCMFIVTEKCSTQKFILFQLQVLNVTDRKLIVTKDHNQLLKEILLSLCFEKIMTTRNLQIHLVVEKIHTSQSLKINLAERLTFFIVNSF